jgi:hypothetical protein
MGIEPTSEAWEALDKTLKAIDLAALSFPSDSLSWNLNGNWVPLRIAAASCELRLSTRPTPCREAVGASLGRNNGHGLQNRGSVPATLALAVDIWLFDVMRG